MKRWFIIGLVILLNISSTYGMESGPSIVPSPSLTHIVVPTILAIGSLVPTNINYVQKPVLGQHTISVQGPDAKKNHRLANTINKFYTRNSRSLFTLKYVTTGNAKYKFKVTRGRGHNNVNGLSSYLGHVGIHEMGHKLRLGHSKWAARDYKVKKSSKFYGKHFADIGSIMNQYARNSNTLISAQYWKLGWLPDNEVVYWNPDKPRQYTLKQIDAFDQPGLSCIVIAAEYWNVNNTEANPLFISITPKGKFAFHLYAGGGTIDYGEYTKLNEQFTLLNMNFTILNKNTIHID